MSDTTKFKTAMVIDDNNIDRYVTARLIRKNSIAGHVLEFSSGLEALRYLTENIKDPAMLPDVIFVDIYMPEMSGFEFMSGFDALPAVLKDSCSCYMVSSTIDEKDIDRANADENVVAFHEKPIDPAFFECIPKNDAPPLI